MEYAWRDSKKFTHMTSSCSKLLYKNKAGITQRRKLLGATANCMQTAKRMKMKNPNKCLFLFFCKYMHHLQHLLQFLYAILML